MAKESEKKALGEKEGAQLAALFERYYDRIVGYFGRQGFGRDDAKDLAQETFLRAGRGLESFRGEASDKTWLTEIARNVYRNWLRDNGTLKKKRFEISIDTAATDDEQTPAQELQLADPGPSPEDEMLDAEETTRLHEAIESLPAQRRQSIELRLRDLKYAEIAKIMGLSIETVKSHLYQARDSLGKALSGGTEGGGPADE